MQIKNICGNTGYISTKHALITTYALSEKEIILFDSGETESQELLDLLEDNHLRVRAVFCTHLHPDHTANNHILYNRHGAEIFHPQEKLPDFSRKNRPEYPFQTVNASKSIFLDGAEIRSIATPGHSSGHLCYVTPDDVCCVGDALLSQPILKYTRLPYMENIEQAVDSMKRIRDTEYPYYVVAHKAVVSSSELPDLIDQNIRKELDLQNALRIILEKPTPIESAVTDYMHSLGITRSEVLESVYVRDLVKIRIQALSETGECEIRGNEVIPHCR